MAEIDVTQAADIRAVLGAPGTGKSHYTKEQISKAKRVLIWDLEDEYTDTEAVPLSVLAERLHHAGRRGFRLRYIPSTDATKRAAEFDIFCRIVMAVGSMLVVIEELRFMTTPSRAPAGWAGITLRGRKRGVKVIGTSQRPASIDKDFLGAATIIRVGALNYPADRKAVADVMGIGMEEIEALTGHQALLWQRTPRKITKTA